jgi:transmembrane sensor
MKEKMKTEELNDRAWEELAPGLTDKKEIDVDKAWYKVWSRMNESGNMTKREPGRLIFMRSNLMKIAAAILILAGLGTAAIYIGNTDALSKKIIVATGGDLKNNKVSLPDGSIIYLNHNTEMTYLANFGKKSRKVTLSGEAFFEIAADASKPFTIDAGKASVRVIGTSFNVITDNIDSAVEVFVRTGKVMLSDNSGDRDLMLEPGYIGTMNSSHAEKTLNKDTNYLAWKNGMLHYEGQTLDIVFNDLKRVFNMEIIADDPSILSNTWTAPIDIQSQDTIIRLICTSFNLSYSKDGNIYHLAKK